MQAISLLKAGRSLMGNSLRKRTGRRPVLIISERSLMPADYAQRLSKQELDDLLAFLARQSVRPAETARKEKN